MGRPLRVIAMVV